MQRIDPSASSRTSLLRSAWQWWSDLAVREGRFAATQQLGEAIWEFVRPFPLLNAATNVMVTPNTIGIIESTPPARRSVGATGCLEFSTRRISRHSPIYFEKCLRL